MVAAGRGVAVRGGERGARGVDKGWVDRAGPPRSPVITWCQPPASLALKSRRGFGGMAHPPNVSSPDSIRPVQRGQHPDHGANPQTHRSRQQAHPPQAPRHRTLVIERIFGRAAAALRPDRQRWLCRGPRHEPCGQPKQYDAHEPSDADDDHDPTLPMYSGALCRVPFSAAKPDFGLRAKSHDFVISNRSSAPGACPDRSRRTTPNDRCHAPANRACPGG